MRRWLAEGSRFCLWAIGLSLYACHGSSATEPPVALAQSVVEQPGTPPQNLVRAYLRLQSKLAKDDEAGARSEFAAVKKAAGDKALTIDPALQKRIDGAASQGAAAPKIVGARVAFSALSDALLAYLKSIENPLQQPLSVSFCPMANDGKGSKWLQLGEKIQNPYFGSEMLTCGVVEGTVKPGAKLQ